MSHKSLTTRCAGGTENKAKSDLLRQQVLTEDYPSYQEQENWKTRYRDVLLEWGSGAATAEQMLEAAECRLKAWYFRSAKRIPYLHPSYPIFVSMLMAEDSIRMLFPEEICSLLVKRYGRRKGEIDGSYWSPPSPAR